MLAVEPLFLLDVAGVFAEQPVSLVDIEVLVIDPPVKVERDPADVDALAALVVKDPARDVEDQAIAEQSGGHDVEVVVDRVGHERRPGRVSAGPDDKLGPLIRQSLPDLGEVDVEANCQAEPAEVRLMDGHDVASCHGGLKVELGPVGVDLVIGQGNLPLAVEKDGRVPTVRAVLAIDRADDVSGVLSGQGSHRA